MGSGSLILDGREVGRIVWSVSGGTADIRAHCPFENGFIYRVSLHCGERTEYLGVMQPDGTQFALRKKLAGGANWLSAPGGEPVGVITRTRPGEAVPSPANPPAAKRTSSDFQSLGSADFLTEGTLKDAFNCKADILYSKVVDGYLLAFPIDEGAETNFSAFLSAAVCRHINGRTYGVLKVGSDGHICE